MDENRLPKRNLNYRPERRRNIGRPQTRWDIISGRNEQFKRPKPYRWWWYNIIEHDVHKIEEQDKL